MIAKHVGKGYIESGGHRVQIIELSLVFWEDH